MTQDLLVTPLSEAVKLHAAGSLDAAHELYKVVLTNAPRETQALHGLALIAIDRGLPEKAVPLLVTCLQITPNDPIYRTSLGLALLKAGHTADAAAHLLEATNRAPHLPEPRLHLARALSRLGRQAQALEILTETAAHFPSRADLWIAKGQEERLQNQPKAAEISFRRALELLPEDANALNDLGVVIRAQGRTREAVGVYREALSRAPRNPLTHGNLGNALTALGELQTAEDHLREAVALAPGSVDHRCNLAIFLTAQDRAEEAAFLFRDVLMRAPGHADAWTNFGIAQLDMGDVVAAETSIRRAIALQPRNAEAHYNLAWVLLLTGQWREGWAEYEWRWRMPHFSSKRRSFDVPRWTGVPLEGTLLLHAEQGIGDAIQFARYAVQARPRCGCLVLECPKPLVRLFETLPGVDAVIAAGAPLPPIHAHAPLMSLPHIFGTVLETTPAPIPYLSPPIARTALRLPNHGRKRIGLVWAGSPDNKIDRRRSIPARLFAPLIEETAADFVSLQVGPKAVEINELPCERLVLSCNGIVNDFADSAAVIAQLDLVIGVDTAVVHLAGALNVPTWALIPFMPDYRWLLERDDTPWYPRMRLFRQVKAGDWDELMWRLRAALTLLQSSP